MELTEEELLALPRRPMTKEDLLLELGGTATPNPVRLESRVCKDLCFPEESKYGKLKHRHVVGLPGIRMARF